jgi:hypothetical protein
MARYGYSCSVEACANIFRGASSLGTDTILGLMSKHFVMSVVTMERNQYAYLDLSYHRLPWQYWDFGKWTDPEKSPIFDGTDTSISGNGKKVSHKATSVGPAQNGGGCVETGPFAK